MASHLYSGLLTKLKWFVRRFGWGEVFLKPIRSFFAPLTLRFATRKQFQWRGKRLDGFYHRYNITWAGERFVEIPIAETYLAAVDPGEVLEVGNVLKHYSDFGHVVVDKYETGAGVENFDIVEYSPQKRFKLILSISTFEHIGFDDDSTSGSGEKIMVAVRHCRHLLSRDGLLVLTVPLGYNPELDEIIFSNRWHASAVRCLKRTGFTDWEECALDDAARYPYRKVHPYANSLAVVEFKAGEII